MEGFVNGGADSGDLAHWFSQERMSRFQFHEHPERLYVWNTRMTKALLEDIQHLEVLLRNRVDYALRPEERNGGYGPLWFIHPSIPFRDPARTAVVKARRRTGQRQLISSPGKIIAELSFDFWYFLFTATYTTTVWPKFSRSIDSGVGREAFRTELQIVYELRNRCAHHEPIVFEDSDFEAHELDSKHNALFTVAGWIDPAAADWIRMHSRVATIRAQRP